MADKYFIRYPGSLPYPGKCSGCGSPSRECLDLGMDRDDNGLKAEDIGAVLMCTSCFGEAAGVMNYEKSDDMGLADAIAESKSDKEEVERLRDTIRRIAIGFIDNLPVDQLLADFETTGQDIGEIAGQVNSTSSGEGPVSVSGSTSDDDASSFGISKF